MKLQLAQIEMVVGDFEGNLRRLLESWDRAEAGGVDLVVAPELAVCGYPPHDWLQRPEFIDQAEHAIQSLIDASKGRRSSLLVGTVRRSGEPTGRPLVNVALAISEGAIVFEQAKSLLPTYDIFDESRYFEPAREQKVWAWRGERIAVGVCEDFWAHGHDADPYGVDPRFNQRLSYQSDPVAAWKTLRPTLAISLSASPFEQGKAQLREQVHQAVAERLGCPVVYVNGVGAVDEVLLDGGSFALEPLQGPVVRAPIFCSGDSLIEVVSGRLQLCESGPTLSRSSPLSGGPSPVGRLAEALVFGIRKYFEQSGITQALIGLSGGIDSAVVAALAVRALGRENVLGIGMPGPYSSAGSLRDAEALARNLGIRFEVHPIKMATSFLAREWSRPGREIQGLTLENLQARLRGLTLMTLSNRTGALVLVTGNKSEIAMGYSTLYGDMCGALAPIGDLWKTEVYDLARELNRMDPVDAIPQESLVKAPSAELRPEQKDQDSLPPYAVMDQLLRAYLELNASIAELEAEFEAPAFLAEWSASKVEGASKVEAGWVRKTLRIVERCEFKRRQSAPVLRVSSSAFGIGRKMPTSARMP